MEDSTGSRVDDASRRPQDSSSATRRVAGSPSGPARTGGRAAHDAQATDETIKYAARTWAQVRAKEFEREGPPVHRARHRHRVRPLSTATRSWPTTPTWPTCSSSEDGALWFLRRADRPEVRSRVMGTMGAMQRCGHKAAARHPGRGHRDVRGGLPRLPVGHLGTGGTGRRSRPGTSRSARRSRHRRRPAPCRELLWQTVPTFGGGPFGGASSGPVTTANGVVFGCALDPQGHMYALNGATGAILWTFCQWRLLPVGRRHLRGPAVLGVGLLVLRHAEQQALLVRLARLAPRGHFGRLSPAAPPAGALLRCWRDSRLAWGSVSE